MRDLPAPLRHLSTSPDRPPSSFVKTFGNTTVPLGVLGTALSTEAGVRLFSVYLESFTTTQDVEYEPA